MKGIKVSEELYLKLKSAAKDFGFESVEDFLRFVVDKLSSGLNQEEEKKAKEQLKKLGYL